MASIFTKSFSCFHLSSGDGGMDISPEMLADLKVEAKELIDKYGLLYANLSLAIENGVELTRDDVDDLFRTLHSLKGLARMAGLAVAEGLLHKLEDYVDAIRNGKKQFDKDDLNPLSEMDTVFVAIFDEAPAVSAETQANSDRLAMYFANKADGQTPSAAPAANSSVSPNEPTTSSSGGGGGEGLTTDEFALYEKFKARAENFFAVTFAPGEFADKESLTAGETVDGISRIGELILVRCDPVKGGLAVFAAELDGSMLEALFGPTTVPITKEPNALAAVGGGWSGLVFEASGGGGSDDLTFPVADAFPDAPDMSLSDLPELGGGSSATATVSVSSHASGADHGHATASPEDDFDTVNLSTPFSAADLDPELLQDFLSNADELLEQLNQSMLELESNPANKGAIEAIFRSAHTIKGTAGMFGFRAIEKLTHVMENLFDRIRKDQLGCTPALVDGLLFGLDRVRSMFESIKKGQTSEMAINDAIIKLKVDANGNVIVAGRPGGAASSTPAAVSAPKAVAPAVPTAPSAPVATSTSPANSASSGDAKPAEVQKAAEGSGTIRVDLKRLDALVNLVGELVIDRTRFARIEEELRNKNDNSGLGHQMSESVLLFGRHMNEVQNIIMKIRMVPVGSVFNKFTRVVRDLARQCNKEIELQIEGAETELDKTLVEEIGDPLIHLIRNSCDHGIEMPDERAAKGKNRRGTIKLCAYQDGNMIVISIQDDGKGLPADRIRAKGLQNGLIKEGDHLTDKEIFNLIFEPGFSTAEKVTNLSGRGVGMDVVKKNILKLKGIVELDSKAGEGTTTIIKLPLTLAIIPSLMVEANGESYAIPLVNVVESIRISPEDIQKIGSADFVKLRDRVLPLLKLADVFELNQMEERLWYRVDHEGHLPIRKDSAHNDEKKSPETQVQAGPALPVTSSERRKRQRKPRLIFVVVNAGEKRVGVVVDQLMGQQEIVVKSLGKLLSKQRGVAGGCVLGNGRVALVVDVGELVEDFSQNKAGYSHRAAS